MADQTYTWKVTEIHLLRQESVMAGHGTRKSLKLLLVRGYKILSVSEKKFAMCVHGNEQGVAFSMFEYKRRHTSHLF